MPRQPRELLVTQLTDMAVISKKRKPQRFAVALLLWNQGSLSFLGRYRLTIHLFNNLTC